MAQEKARRRFLWTGNGAGKEEAEKAYKDASKKAGDSGKRLRQAYYAFREYVADKSNIPEFLKKTNVYSNLYEMAGDRGRGDSAVEDNIRLFDRLRDSGMSEEDAQRLLTAHNMVTEYKKTVDKALKREEKNNPTIKSYQSDLDRLHYILKPENLPETLKRLEKNHIDPMNYLAAASVQIAALSQALADGIQRKNMRRRQAAVGGPVPEDMMVEAEKAFRKIASDAGIREEDRKKPGYRAAAAFADQELKSYVKGRRKARNELVNEAKRENLVEIQRHQDLLNSYHWYGGRFTSNSSEYDSLFADVDKLTEYLGPVASDPFEEMNAKKNEARLIEIIQVVAKLKDDAAAYLRKNGDPGTQGSDMGRNRAEAAQYFYQLADKLESKLFNMPSPEACLYGLDADPVRIAQAKVKQKEAAKVKKSSIKELDTQINQKKMNANPQDLSDENENEHYKVNRVMSMKGNRKRNDHALNGKQNGKQKGKTEHLRNGSEIKEPEAGMNEIHT